MASPRDLVDSILRNGEMFSVPMDNVIMVVAGLIDGEDGDEIVEYYNNVTKQELHIEHAYSGEENP